MYKVPEEDRKIFLEYLAKKPYIEVAALVARVAAWQKDPKEKKETKIIERTLALVLSVLFFSFFLFFLLE